MQNTLRMVELQAQLSKELGYTVVASAHNGSMPLACERVGPPGAPQSGELAGPSGLWLMQADVPVFGDGQTPSAASSRFATDAAARAADIAKNGFGCDPAAAAAIAAKALAISPDVGDAYSIKAMRCAGSLEEALELFRAGRAAAERALKPEFSAAALAAAASASNSSGGGKKRRPRSLSAWEMMEVRPLIRAQYGAPLALLGRMLLRARAALLPISSISFLSSNTIICASSSSSHHQASPTRCASSGTGRKPPPSTPLWTASTPPATSTLVLG
jgi:hypothetical protein